MPSPRTRSSTRSATHRRRRTSQGEYDLPDLVRHLRRRGRAVETVPPRRCRRRSAASTAATSWPRCSAMRATSASAELMAAGVTLIDPATTYVGPTSRSGTTPSPSQRLPRGSHADRRAAARFTPARASSIRRSTTDVVDPQLLRHQRVAARRARHRTVRAPPPRQRRRRRAQRRQLRRAQEDDARHGSRRPTTSPTSATRRSARR